MAPTLSGSEHPGDAGAELEPGAEREIDLIVVPNVEPFADAARRSRKVGDRKRKIEALAPGPEHGVIGDGHALPEQVVVAITERRPLARLCADQQSVDVELHAVCELER